MPVRIQLSEFHLKLRNEETQNENKYKTMLDNFLIQYIIKLSV